MSSAKSVSFVPFSPKVHTELYLNRLKESSKVAMIVEVLSTHLWHEEAISGLVGDTYCSLFFFNCGALIWCLKFGEKLSSLLE